ncbi:CheR family methyltransferase [Metabacillus sp. B2-18]|uniref:CheR family methyltransferase n=1 Tax=Metabacillus sp. B2-18 TaxID=2897333 RepID=UPI001E4FB864|nr:protein-glutamate O-methyltransferase CheR [Metabacillus sp. B2-18]UGB30214.1 protein-glutamate O-methyltransferase CheR [Metabacillus sp. B2-18]
MENFALKQLAQLVYEYCGLNYLNNISSLEAKISKRLEQLSVTLWSYMRLLEENPKEWDILVELLTINETYFYREDKQLHVFQNKVIPILKKERALEQPIKIWSAACSTGEEPYSLVMMLNDLDVTLEDKVTITATDINKKVLQTATNGIYHKKSLSFRRIPQKWLDTYFEETENHYSVKKDIQDTITFKYLNLLDEENMRNEGLYDVIFCRNVLIYFDAETVKKVATSFYHSLKKGGYLFLGHAENISTMGIGFETISTDGTFYYRKG